jgi:hypothetical protein
MFFDVSSVDFLGIPMSLQLQPSPSATPSITYGVQPGAGTRVAAGLNALGAPWSSLVQTFPGGRRIMNPAHAIGGVFNFPPNYLASYMNAICNAYPATSPGSDLVLGGSVMTPNGPSSLIPSLPTPAPLPNQTPAPGPFVYGRYSGTCGTASQVLTFWDTPNMKGNIVASFAGVPSSTDAFGNAGYFAALAPTMQGQTPPPATFIGRILSVSIDRGTVAPTPTPPAGFATAAPAPTPASQPVCNANAFYGGALTNYGANPQAWFTTDWYAALLHANSFNNGVYAFADDDECGVYSSTINPVDPSGGPGRPAGYRFVVTLQPF